MSRFRTTLAQSLLLDKLAEHPASQRAVRKRIAQCVPHRAIRNRHAGPVALIVSCGGTLSE